jgi:glutaredoxin
MKRWWVIAVALLSIGGAADAQYRWRDVSGQVNYGDFPPGDARDLKPVGAQAPVETVDANLTLPFELRRAKALYPVVLYSSDACPPCENARVYLRQRGVPFSERVVETPADNSELKRITGIEMVPVITVGKDTLAGFNNGDWSRALDAAGYPSVSKLPAGYAGEPPRSLISRVSGPANRVAPNGEMR